MKTVRGLIRTSLMNKGEYLKLLPDTQAKTPSPTVSVIIPVYDRYPMLLQAAASVLCQTYRDFELIIADDGSTDETAQINSNGLAADLSGVIEAGQAIRFPALDYRHPGELEPIPPPAFRYVRIDHTGMPGAARNAGAQVAMGAYLAFLDSDDLWLPQKLELQTALMKSSSCPISHTREVWLRDGQIVSQASQKHKRKGRLFEDSLVKCIIGPSTVMIERSLFLETGGFREDLQIGEDYELWLRITSKQPVAYIDTPLTVKRAGHPDQLTSKYGQIEIFRIHALASLLDAGFFEGDSRGLAAAELSRKCMIYANGAKKRGRDEEAAKYRSMARAYSAK